MNESKQDTVTFDVHYYRETTDSGLIWSHKISETWMQTQYYCPACGGQNIWRETGGGDYYVGNLHICLICEINFFLPDEPSVSTYFAEPDKQRLLAIKNHIAQKQ